MTVPPKPVARLPKGSSASTAKPKPVPAVTLPGGSLIKVNCDGRGGRYGDCAGRCRAQTVARHRQRVHAGFIQGEARETSEAPAGGAVVIPPSGLLPLLTATLPLKEGVGLP